MATIPLYEEVYAQLRALTGHYFVLVTTRGNTAITAALSLLPTDKRLLIPEEGGWIHYYKAPEKLKLGFEKVKCDQAKIKVADLEQKLKKGEFSALLYQQPGGYFAEQPMKVIYELCARYGCLVIMDVSGSIGTRLCDGRYADILVGSFRKLVDASEGGFITFKDEELWQKGIFFVEELRRKEALEEIEQKLIKLPARISFLTETRRKIMKNLAGFNLIHRDDIGFVVMVKFNDEAEKEKIIKYCTQEKLPWTECPRYIRLNEKAISIELKQLESE